MYSFFVLNDKIDICSLKNDYFSWPFHHYEKCSTKQKRDSSFTLWMVNWKIRGGNCLLWPIFSTKDGGNVAVRIKTLIFVSGRAALFLLLMIKERCRPITLPNKWTFIHILSMKFSQIRQLSVTPGMKDWNRKVSWVEYFHGGPGPAPATAMSSTVQLYIDHGYTGEKGADQVPAHF